MEYASSMATTCLADLSTTTTNKSKKNDNSHKVILVLHKMSWELIGKPQKMSQGLAFPNGLEPLHISAPGSSHHRVKSGSASPNCGISVCLTAGMSKFCIQLMVRSGDSHVFPALLGSRTAEMQPVTGQVLVTQLPVTITTRKRTWEAQGHS